MLCVTPVDTYSITVDGEQLIWISNLAKRAVESFKDPEAASFFKP